ncbi:DnaB-like helicase C-terminal domain-containing protein [Aquimarina sp. ERC-38]|uniref:DnaB-like helicase C-terminal domain-containing protein n=1 Tax=Aquimarina sp. ERC-38 TaxID=2949996 RepID=UPI0022461181|nr:DnaB-like helicase C-terminal domain-containing protein [Aquimarina sp. ERC-38]UZO82115.1 DnaB-like helicase C-terminal domain-containing protein [Aquimarina sp. ERC-38]
MDKIISTYNSSIQLIEDSSNGVVNGVLSGFNKLDQITNGFQNSELTVIGGRPSMDKTSLAISLAIKIGAKNKNTLGIFSLQMPVYQFVSRMISQETGFSALKLKKGELEKHEWEILHTYTKNIKEAPIYLQHSHCMNINEIIMTCNELVEKKQVKCILIDKLQLIEPLPSDYKFNNREQEINKLVIKLKQTTLRLNIPIILFSDLNRLVEGRGGYKRPLLSDLRDSGQIENEADIVAFIYRPEQYGIAEWEDEESSSTSGEAEFCIKKHNVGEFHNIKLSFNSMTGKFNNLSKKISSQFDNRSDDPFSDIGTKQESIFGSRFNNLENDDIPF